MPARSCEGGRRSEARRVYDRGRVHRARPDPWRRRGDARLDRVPAFRPHRSRRRRRAAGSGTGALRRLSPRRRCGEAEGLRLLHHHDAGRWPERRRRTVRGVDRGEHAGAAPGGGRCRRRRGQVPGDARRRARAGRERHGRRRPPLQSHPLGRRHRPWSRGNHGKDARDARQGERGPRDRRSPCLRRVRGARPPTSWGSSSPGR